MLYFTYSLNFILMIALPCILIIGLRRRFATPWPLFVWGAVAFVGSQLVRLPLLFGLTILFTNSTLPAIPKDSIPLFNVVFLSLTAGLFEEGARYLVYRRFIPNARSWKAAISFGAGHGGVESVIIGVITALGTTQYFVMRDLDLTTLGIPAEQLPLVQQQVAAFWSAAWYLTLLGAVERVFALCLHISLSVLVLQAFTRHNLGWLLVAIGWHTLANMLTSLLPVLGPVGVEGLLGIVAAISLGLVYWLRDRPSGLADSGVEAVANGVADSSK